MEVRQYSTKLNHDDIVQYKWNGILIQKLEK